MIAYTQEQLTEILRLHGMWLRGEHGGERANLRDADLSEADLRGTRCRSLPSDRYCAYTVPSEGGQILHYGCERRTLDDWEVHVAAICKNHVPNEADRYEAEIRALIAYCRIVEKEAK